MDLDRSIPRRSPIHAFDARLKFIGAIAAIAAISLQPVGAFGALALMFVALVAASMLARLGPWRLVRGAFVALPFMLIALPLVFVRPGDPIASLDLGPLRVTIGGEGLRAFATIAAKSWLSVQVALLLTYTTPFHDLLDALRELRLPRILVAIIGFMYRYLAVLGDEAQRLIRARASRSALADGVAGGGSIAWRARVTGNMVGSLFLRSYERSERIYDAMIARGFEGTFRHLGLRPITVGEWTAIGVLLLALVGWTVASQLWWSAS